MIFNGIEKEYITVLRGRERPTWSTRGEKRFVNVPVKVNHEVKNGMFGDLQKKKEDIASWLIHEDYKELKFKDELDRIYLAKIESEMVLEEFPYWAEGVIEFECIEKLSTEKSIQSNNHHEIQGHESTFWRTHTEFTSNVTGYELAFTPAGKSELKDINKIVLNGDFRSGDILEIDYRKRRVTLNKKHDISNQLVIMQSNYRELDIGSVEISSSVPTTVYYHERYY